MIDLTQGNEGKQILRFAVPMLLGNLFQQLYNIVDSAVIGQFVGTEALAAVGASFPLIFVLISLIIGLASGSTIIISQYYGAKEIDNVKKTIETMFIYLFFASIAVSIIGISLSGPIFKLIDIPADVMPQAKIYFNIYIGGIVLLFGFNGTAAILRGLGDSKTPLYFMMIATIMNIGLDLLFILVFKWGVVGAAVATLISQGGAFITSIIYLNRTHDIFQLTVSKLRFDRDIFKKSMRIGLPSGFQQTFVALGMLALLKIVNIYGTTTLAAYTVAGRIDMFAALPAMNFAAALSAFVGQNMGANKIERVRNGYRATLMLSSGISIAVTILVVIFGESLMRLFSQNPDVVSTGVEYLVIVSSFYIIFSFMFVNNAVLRGAGDTIVPMIITLLALWVVRVPASYLLSLKYGEIGIWWGVPAAWLVGAVMSYIYYKSGKWKNKGVVQHN
ncbi:MAG: MATE family efflux transporter [Bacteroidetes bacterium]|nr:MATE family efflux transporter [Bacteroidota bacterium]MBL6963908.1 MATE family efflux transporter [Bacteroidota bacterium]